VFKDLEDLIQEAPQEHALVRGVNQNFGEIYAPRLANLTHSLDTVQENQKKLDIELGLTNMPAYRKIARSVEGWWNKKILTLDDLYEMQRKCLDYMRTTLEETLEHAKEESEKLVVYAKEILGRLQRAEPLLYQLQEEAEQPTSRDISVYERAKLVVEQQDQGRKKEFATTRLEQFMKNQVHHYQGVRALVGVMREVVEVYTLVHDQVVIDEQNLEVVMGGHRLIERANEMAPLYAKGLQQSSAFGKELSIQLQEGVRRLYALKTVVVKRGYVS